MFAPRRLLPLAVVIAFSFVFIASAGAQAPQAGGGAQEADRHAGGAHPRQEGLQGRAALLGAQADAGLVGQHDVDPKGRLITSDQYGKLYRITPPAIGGKRRGHQGRATARRAGRGAGPALGVRQPLCRRQRGAEIQAARPVARYAPPRTTTCSTRRSCCGRSTAAASTALTRSSSARTANRSTSLCGNHTKPIKVDLAPRCRRSGARISWCRACGTPPATPSASWRQPAASTRPTPTARSGR